MIDVLLTTFKIQAYVVGTHKDRLDEAAQQAHDIDLILISY